MTSLNALLAFIAHHDGAAYVAIFLTSFSESLALVGLIVPGTVIMFAIGAIVATGSLGLKPALLLAAAGAAAGDGVSYWLGRKYRDELLRIWPFRRYPEMIKKGAVFFYRHGGKSVLFGRFIGPLRPVIPMVAGILGMGPVQFGVVNGLSAVGWALVYLLPGLFFGTSLALAGTVSMRLAVLLFLILATAWAFVWLLVRLISLVGRRGPLWFAALKAWVAANIPSQGIALSLRRLLVFLFYRPHGEEVFFGALVLVFFGAVWGFLGVLQDVLAKDPLVLADQSVYHFLQSLRTPWADRIFVALTEFGDAFVNICLAGSVLLVLLAKRCFRTAGFWVITVLGGQAAVQGIKWMIHLPRPAAIYQGMSAYGFPSGHTTMSVVLYGFLAIILAKGLAARWRWGIFVFVLLVSFFIAISRLYLGAHWLSDVLGGFFIGTSWAALLGIAYLKQADEGVPRRLLGWVALLVVVIAGSWHVLQRHETDLRMYAPRQMVQSMPLAAWLDRGWRDLPSWRIDMAGQREHPLTIQWAGQPDDLFRYLATQGWQPAPPLNLKHVLEMLSPDAPIEKLPVLPHLNSGRAAGLCLVHSDHDARWVLRLWPADIDIAGGSVPLFVGSITVQHRRHLTWLITVAGDTDDYDRPRDMLARMLRDRFSVKTVQRAAEAIQADHGHHQLQWQGKVLLLLDVRDGTQPGNNHSADIKG